MVATSEGQGALFQSPPSHLLPLTALPTYGMGMGVGTTVVPASAQAPPLAFLILGGEGG